MLSFARATVLAAVVCSVVALNGVTVSASGLELDPYTLSDGTVVDPSKPEGRAIAADRSDHEADPNTPLGQTSVRGWARRL